MLGSLGRQAISTVVRLFDCDGSRRFVALYLHKVAQICSERRRVYGGYNALVHRPLLSRSGSRETIVPTPWTEDGSRFPLKNFGRQSDNGGHSNSKISAQPANRPGGHGHEPGLDRSHRFAVPTVLLAIYSRYTDSWPRIDLC